MRDIITFIVGVVVDFSKYSMEMAVVGAIAGAIVGFIIGKFCNITRILF